jgi:UDP-N-acetylmuramyl pentapeptide phosphotransferase/UDP-N-acetylglucosamine-1-phosphate transferase
MPVLAVVLAAGVSAAVVWALRAGAAHLPQSAPNARTLHVRPVPRVGGLSIWGGWLPVALLEPPPVAAPFAAWLGCLGLVAAVSLLDDWRNASIALRLGIHAVAAIVVTSVIMSGAGSVQNPAATTVSLLVILWAANLYNFMDGSDGLAATMTLVGFAALATGAHHAGGSWVAYAALAAATLPFLAVNRPPASMFMGDVGAVPLGFAAAAFSVDGWVRGAWPAWFPALVFMPFIVDASVTLARRAFSGEKVWQPHRDHYYQRLHQLGFGHRGTLAVYGGLIAGCAIAALACLRFAPQAGPYALAAFGAVHAMLFATIDYHWRRQADPG